MKDLHCQNGHADLCWAARLDGIVCPSDSCDVDDGVVKFDGALQPRRRNKKEKEIPQFTKEELGMLMLATNVAYNADCFLGGKNFPIKAINELQQKIVILRELDD